VVSNVYTSPPPSQGKDTGDDIAVNGEKKTSKDAANKLQKSNSRTSGSTKITIHGLVPVVTSPPSSPPSKSHKDKKQTTEKPLLELYPQTHTLASEWLDGLLMLLNQKPITAETTKLVKLIGSYGLKIRLLNIRYEDLSSDELGHVPAREGLDVDYWYDFGGMMETET
jgi:engulfment and cell motility protein 1